MNQDWEEERIEELFHEMRQVDERSAPPFAKVRAAALARGKKRLPTVFQVAVATCILIVVLASALIFFKHSSRRQAPHESPGSEAWVNPDPERLTPPSAPNVSTDVPSVIVKPSPKIAQRRAGAPPGQSGLVISEWRSPTDFLLKSPADQVLKSVPRLNESIVKVKMFIPVEKKLS